MRISSPLLHSLSHTENGGKWEGFFLSPMDVSPSVKWMNFMCNQIELYTKNLGKVPMCRCQQRNSIKAVAYGCHLFIYHFFECIIGSSIVCVYMCFCVWMIVNWWIWRKFCSKNTFIQVSIDFFSLWIYDIK